jgi:PAS domain S-box-containing protein
MPDSSEGDLRFALDRIVADSVPLVAGALGLLLGFFALVDPFLYDAPASWAIATIDAMCAVLLGALFARAWRQGVPARHAHAYLFTIAAIAVGAVLKNLLLVGDFDQTFYLIIALLGAASLFLSVAWFAALGLVTLGGWALTARAVLAGGVPAPTATIPLALFATIVISIVVQLVRVRTHRRLEVLRLAAERASDERDVREQALESAVRSAWESEQRYRRLVEQAPDAFLVTRKGRILYANAAAVRLFGAKAADDLVRLDLTDLVDPASREAARAQTARAEEDNVATPLTEMRGLRLDGAPVDIELMGQPISFEGSTAGQVIVRDITDRKRAEEEMHVAAQRLAEIGRLQELDRMKTQFVNTLSHELRTPLTPIKVQLHLLKSAREAGDQARMQKAQEMLDRNVARMGGLIDELLEVARLQAGTLKLDKGPLDLDLTVNEALESFKDVAKQSGIDVQARLEPGLHVEADARRLTQIMYNLMNNALKFTPQGGHITIDAHHEGPRAVVSVTDTGVGLKKDDIARLFEPFSQVHDTMQKTNAGTGLGLYICKGIVEGHGGRIWCESPGPGKGTTFSFELPLQGDRSG